jgi:hypothetical protein
MTDNQFHFTTEFKQNFLANPEKMREANINNTPSSSIFLNNFKSLKKKITNQLKERVRTIATVEFIATYEAGNQK